MYSCLSICLLVGLFVCFVCLFVYLSICLSVYLSICLSVYLSIYLPASVRVYLLVCLSVCLSFSLSFCLLRYKGTHDTPHACKSFYVIQVSYVSCCSRQLQEMLLCPDEVLWQALLSSSQSIASTLTMWLCRKRDTHTHRDTRTHTRTRTHTHAHTLSLIELSNHRQCKTVTQDGFCVGWQCRCCCAALQQYWQYLTNTIVQEHCFLAL